MACLLYILSKPCIYYIIYIYIYTYIYNFCVLIEHIFAFGYIFCIFLYLFFLTFLGTESNLDLSCTKYLYI